MFKPDFGSQWVARLAWWQQRCFLSTLQSELEELTGNDAGLNDVGGDRVAAFVGQAIDATGGFGVFTSTFPSTTRTVASDRRRQQLDCQVLLLSKDRRGLPVWQGHSLSVVPG